MLCGRFEKTCLERSGNKRFCLLHCTCVTVDSTWFPEEVSCLSTDFLHHSRGQSSIKKKIFSTTEKVDYCNPVLTAGEGGGVKLNYLQVLD